MCVHPIVEELQSKDALVFGVGLPVVLLLGLFVTASLLPVEFGNVIFSLSIATCFGWILLNLNNQSDIHSGKAKSLLSRRSSRFGDVGEASHQQLLSMAKLLLTSTGVVLMGWAYLLTA